MKRKLSTILALCMVFILSLALGACGNGGGSKTGLFKDLQGTYDELFTVICDSEYDELWLDNCKELVGEEYAEMCAEMLKSACTSTV